MKLAPLGVMALMADLIVGFAGDSDLLLALGYYALTVVIGLCVILLICYPLIIRFFYRHSAPGLCPRRIAGPNARLYVLLQRGLSAGQY